MRAFLRPLIASAAAVGAAALGAAPALAAGSYEFVPAPQLDLNRVYRVDRSTGEVVGRVEAQHLIRLAVAQRHRVGPSPAALQQVLHCVV